VRSSTFTKLGGIYGGSGASWVTRRPSAGADHNAIYTEGSAATAQGYAANYPGPNTLTSPFLDLSSLGGGTDAYISFVHSIKTEPKWDFSMLQYTTDGVTWTPLGVEDDADGINWYASALYTSHTSSSDDAYHCIDQTTWETTYGLPTIPAGGFPVWSSLGNCDTAEDIGPNGWVFVQLHVTNPAISRAPVIRFRYLAFADAVYGPVGGGWAFDNFQIGTSGAVFSGGTIDGHAWNDANGNGVDDGEADHTSTKVYFSYFGVLKDSATTNGTGDYSFSGIDLPGTWNVQFGLGATGYTVPFGNTGLVDLDHPADGSTLTQDYGTFAGSISGMKYSDLNDNGANNGEPGLSGWTIEVHLDSADGEFFSSAVTGVGGTYSIPVPAYAGTYYITEVQQPAIARQTGPVGGEHTATINSGTPTATGKDFGNFLFGRIRVQLTFDINGNGIRDIADASPVPAPFEADFSLKKDGIDLDGSPFTLGGGTIAVNFDSLDAGTYVVTEETLTDGWIRTKGGTDSIVIATSGVNDTADYLDFKYLTISGMKFDDLNGNGVKDIGEPGLEGWKINVAGGTYHGNTSATTDSNGNYSIDSVGPGTHTISEVVQAGWTRTLPGGAGTYVFAAISGHLANPVNDRDFGNFADANVDGIVFRDYDGNGVMDGGDTPISGVTVNLASGPSDVSDGSGYGFGGLVSVDTISIVVPGGYVITYPAAGYHAIAVTSGGGAKGLHFGLFQSTDSSTKYRTFTQVQLSAAAEKKPGKRPKAGKAYDPIKNKPNSANMIFDLIDPKSGQGYTLKVGLAGQLNAGGKTKAYWQPKKQSDVWKSLDNKGIKHTGQARGFDQDLKGKPILKQQKSLPPGKKIDNSLFAHLVALQVNLAASGPKTPAGLGSLLYEDPGNPLHGKTIDEIAAYADSVMTNFEFQPLGIYENLDSIIAKINLAFFYPATDDTASDGGWQAPKLKWAAYTDVTAIPYLKPNPGVAPVNRKTGTPPDVPDAFALEQNYPNPFNPTTTIQFDLPDVSIVTLKVYNLLGQEVATLLDREILDYGEEVEFDASSLPSGVYLYRIVAETVVEDGEEGVSEAFTQVKKMVLVK
jgi:hypothetical protein